MRSRLFQSSAFAGTPGELRRGIEIALRRYVFTSAVVLAVFSVLVRPATAQKYVGTIALPPGSDVYGSMAVDPQSGLLFLPSYDSGELLVADTATDTVIDAISSNRVISAVFDPANNLVY